MGIKFSNVKAFAKESKDLYSAMKEYSKNYFDNRKGLKAFESCSEEEMGKLINKEFALEVARQSGFSLKEGYDNTELKRYANNPMVKFYVAQIRDVLIDMVLPETLMNGTIRYFSEFRYADLGGSVSFHMENNNLYTVSKAGYRKKHTNMQNLFPTTVTLVGENHQVTVGTNLYDIMTGSASLARDVMKVARSIETQMLYEAYDAFSGAMNNLTGNLEVANYSEPSLIKLCETVEAWNMGAKPIILGTPVALKSVLPSNANYRYLLEDEYVKLGHLQTFNGYDVVPMSQVANYTSPTPYSLKLDDTKIYVVSPASQKLVQIGVFGGTYTHQDDAYDYENKLVRNTTEKAWAVRVATNSVAGIVKNLG